MVRRITETCSSSFLIGENNLSDLIICLHLLLFKSNLSLFFISNDSIYFVMQAIKLQPCIIFIDEIGESFSSSINLFKFCLHVLYGEVAHRGLIKKFEV